MSQHLFCLPHNFNVIQNAKCFMSQMAEFCYSTDSSIKTLVNLNNGFYFMFQWGFEGQDGQLLHLGWEQGLPAMYGVVSWLLLNMSLYKETLAVLPKGKERSTNDTMRLQKHPWNQFKRLTNLRELQFGPN